MLDAPTTMTIFVSLLILLLTATNAFARRCDPSCINLSSKEVWRREAGYWVGNYTFLGPDGQPQRSDAWPYGYAAYHGFILIKLDGPCLEQRNVFVYPPLTAAECARRKNPVLGDGACGVNGNEKIFEASQTATDCDGNLAGPFGSGEFTVDTKTTITLGESDTVLYQVRVPNGKQSGPIIQNQITTVDDNGFRVRTAQGLIPGTARGIFASFFREERVSKEVWESRLKEVRAKFNVRKEDYCGWDFLDMPSGRTCEQQFTIPKCPKRTGGKRCRKVRKRYNACVERGSCRCAS